MTGSPALREYVRTHAENRPGVYRMLDRRGDVLYVGKSIRIRARLLSYFRADPTDKPGRLIREAGDIAWDYIPNEFSALIREMKLIQRWRPRFNVEHKRRRAYAFVKVTREPAPRLLPVTRVVDDGATYYGPFPRVGQIAAVVRELAHLLGIRDCPGTTPVSFDDQLELFRGSRTPLCLRADTGSCLAPCAGRCRSDEYAERVQLAHRFLDGRGRRPLDDLRSRMEDAAGRFEFEYAALLRDRHDRLERFRDHLLTFRGHVRSLSFVYRLPGFAGDDRIYLIRRGRIRGELPRPRTAEERAWARSTASSIFAEPDEDPAALDADAAAEVLLVARWFRTRPGERRRTSSPDEWMASGTPGPARAPSPGPPASDQLPGINTVEPPATDSTRPLE